MNYEKYGLLTDDFV